MARSSQVSVAPLACAVGAAALVGQTVLVRELMVSFYGTELALACALCCWLLFVALGTLSAASLLKAFPLPLRLARLALIALAVGLQAQFVLARLVRPLLEAGAGQFLSVRSMLVGAAAAALPAAFPVGFFFTAACRWQESQDSRVARGIGRVYVAEAVGSGITGAILSFVLVGRVAPGTLVAGACAVVLLAGAVHAWLRREWRPALACAILLVVGGVALTAGGRALERASALARWRTYSTFRLLEARDTRYQHLELGAREGDQVLVQNGRTTSQFPDTVAVRQQAALLLTQHPDPRDVLIVGGGLVGLCQQMLAAPLRTLNCVEADPQVVSLLLSRLPEELREPLADPRFAVYRYDGRHFVRRLAHDPASLAEGRMPVRAGESVGARVPPAAYDLVVINVGDPTSASDSRFYTVEFCRQLERILRPGGVVAFCGITSSENYGRGRAVLDYTACVYRTLRTVFGTVVVRPGDEFCFFAARAPGSATSDPRELVARFERLGIGPEALKYGFELAEFPAERTRWAADLLAEAEPRALLSTDARPVAFTLFLAVQGYYAARGDGRRTLTDSEDVFARVRATGPLWLWLPFGALLVPLALVKVGGGRRLAVPAGCALVTFTTGLFGLSAEMLVVYGYQVAFGYVYRDISILVGLFMVGLAAGGWVTSRFAGPRIVGALVLLELLQAALILAMPAAVSVLSFSPWAFMCLAAGAGFLTGASFPLAARASLCHASDPGAVAGVLGAADHMGAMIGAACVGLLLVPAAGLISAAALLALVKCVSLFGLLLVSNARLSARGPEGAAA